LSLPGHSRRNDPRRFRTRQRGQATVRMSASEIVSAEILPPMSAILRERYPELAIERVLSDAIDNLLRREAIAVRMVGRPRTRPW
jgi:DNA-binding transcriptional LysR family regulator